MGAIFHMTLQNSKVERFCHQARYERSFEKMSDDTTIFSSHSFTNIIEESDSSIHHILGPDSHTATRYSAYEALYHAQTCKPVASTRPADHSDHWTIEHDPLAVSSAIITMAHLQPSPVGAASLHGSAKPQSRRAACSIRWPFKNALRFTKGGSKRAVHDCAASSHARVKVRRALVNAATACAPLARVSCRTA